MVERAFASLYAGRAGRVCGFKPEDVFGAFLISGLSNQRSPESAKSSTTIV